MNRRTALVVGAPLVAVATLMVGLRVGAGEGFQAALVYGAHPSYAASAAEPHRYAFQMITYWEDRGVREAVAIRDLVVDIRTEDGHAAQWKGASNEDGVAEIVFELPGQPTRIAFDARVAGEREPLAFGIVDLTRAPKRPADTRTAQQRQFDARVRPSKSEGALSMAVYLESGRLAVGSPKKIWVHVAGASGAEGDAVPVVHATPEIGLAFDFDDAKADCFGYAVFSATALGQAASTQFEAKLASDKSEKGVWFGTIPTAPGAFSIQLPPHFTGTTKPETWEAVVVAPNPRKTAYVEVDDSEGRVWAAALPLTVEPGDPLPRAHVPLGHLADGIYWLVASGDPRGAETMAGATVAKTFIVSRSLVDACDRDLMSAQLLAPGTPRWLALDGIATRGAKNRARHRLGLFIGLLALGTAALLETLLLTRASRESRLAFEKAASDLEPEGVVKTTDKTPGGNLLLALLVALLGFAFLAALVIAKA